MTRKAGKIRLLMAAGGILTLALVGVQARVDPDRERPTPAAISFPQGALVSLDHAANHFLLYHQVRTGSFTRQRRPQIIAAMVAGDPGCDCSQGVTRVIPP